MTARQPNGANPKPVVLVLQDEPILAGIMRDFVEEAGCEAVVVRTAEAAVHILEGRTDIRVVFADLDVRGSTTGLKLIAMIRERWPPIEPGPDGRPGTRPRRHPGAGRVLRQAVPGEQGHFHHPQLRRLRTGQGWPAGTALTPEVGDRAAADHPGTVVRASATWAAGQGLRTRSRPCVPSRVGTSP
ncbi:hypothetical protein ACFQE0_17445 [Methylobacterium komagatae]|uniref:Response regulator n=1 Tax=Methylobacterium komagatae TaxID=374425 RepID=A0ABW2BLB3_9HYPH